MAGEYREYNDYRVRLQQLHFLTIDNVSEVLGCTKAQALSWVRSGHLKSANVATNKNGEEFVVTYDNLRTFIDELTATQAKAPSAPPWLGGRS